MRIHSLTLNTSLTYTQSYSSWRTLKSSIYRSSVTTKVINSEVINSDLTLTVPHVHANNQPSQYRVRVILHMGQTYTYTHRLFIQWYWKTKTSGLPGRICLTALFGLANTHYSRQVQGAYLQISISVKYFLSLLLRIPRSLVQTIGIGRCPPLCQGLGEKNPNFDTLAEKKLVGWTWTQRLPRHRTVMIWKLLEHQSRINEVYISIDWEAAIQEFHQKLVDGYQRSLVKVKLLWSRQEARQADNPNHTPEMRSDKTG